MLEGVLTALVTPFRDGAVDEAPRSTILLAPRTYA